jgi:hypothetical protein
VMDEETLTVEPLRSGPQVLAPKQA